MSKINQKQDSEKVKSPWQRYLMIGVVSLLLVGALIAFVFLKKKVFITEKMPQLLAAQITDQLKIIHENRSKCLEETNIADIEAHKVCMCAKYTAINPAIDKLTAILNENPDLDLEEFPVFDPLVKQDIIYSKDLLPTLRQDLGFCDQLGSAEKNQNSQPSVESFDPENPPED